MSKPMILIIDDEEAYSSSVATALGPRYAFAFARSEAEGLGRIATVPPDVVLLDIFFNGRNGLQVLESLKRTDPALPVIVITSHATKGLELEAHRRGALYFVDKTLGLPELQAKIELCLQVSAAARDRDRLRKETNELRRELDARRHESLSHAHYLATSPLLQNLDAQIDRIAAVSSTVLILGETGTGKSALAWEIHRRSRRAQEPFFAVDLPVLPPPLIESELFGHEQGAFTDARRSHEGYFGAAGAGTLFLDEIGDLHLDCQGKLLRAVEEKRYRPLASTRERQLAARLIVATNRDLPTMVGAGSFRQDLYTRLQVLTLRVPPLRERPEDIPGLVEYFAGRYSAEEGFEGVGFTPEAMQLLASHDWVPGNVRDLRTTVERTLAYHASKRVITPDEVEMPEAVSTDAPASRPVAGTTSNASTLLPYAEAALAAELDFLQGYLGRAFRAVGGDLRRPHPDEWRRAADLCGTTTVTLRRNIRKLQDHGRI